MGEAKLRGSFEERKAMAAERERLARIEHAAVDFHTAIANTISED